jgi:hypothetical protein
MQLFDASVSRFYRRTNRVFSYENTITMTKNIIKKYWFQQNTFRPQGDNEKGEHTYSSVNR